MKIVHRPMACKPVESLAIAHLVELAVLKRNGLCCARYAALGHCQVLIGVRMASSGANAMISASSRRAAR